jgi:hypothetical protein
VLRCLSDQPEHDVTSIFGRVGGKCWVVRIEAVHVSQRIIDFFDPVWNNIKCVK